MASVSGSPSLSEHTPGSDRTFRSSEVTPVRICRICHEGETNSRLYSPCRCSGSVGLVHRRCLERWLGSANTSTCELCNYRFILTRQPRSLREWFENPSQSSDVKNLVGDVVCFLLLTPLAAISCYMCFLGILHFINWNSHLEVAGLMVLCVCLSVIYTAWSTITIRYHLRVWKEWQSSNQTVRLLRLTKWSASEIEGVSRRSDMSMVIVRTEPEGQASPTSTVHVETV